MSGEWPPVAQKIASCFGISPRELRQTIGTWNEREIESSGDICWESGSYSLLEASGSPIGIGSIASPVGPLGRPR